MRRSYPDRACEAIQELPCANVEVSDLPGARRHTMTLRLRTFGRCQPSQTLPQDVVFDVDSASDGVVEVVAAEG